MRLGSGQALRVAPLPLLLSAGLGAGLLILAVVYASLQQAWLGVELQADDRGGGLLVTAVHESGPSHGRLIRGDQVVAIRGTDGAFESLVAFDPALEPHGFRDYAGYNAYLERQGRIAGLLHPGRTLRLVLADGEVVAVQPHSQRPLTALPDAFWLFNLFGLMAFLIGWAVWTFRRGYLPARYLMISGTGFFIATLLNSAYLARELAIPELCFQLLVRGNHLGLTLLLGGLLALLAHYPRRLSSVSPGLLVFAMLALYQVNENLQLVEWPVHTFYLPLIAFYLLGVTIAIRQWQLARRQPLDRAALKWVFLSVFVFMGISLVVYFVPVAFGEPPLLSQTAMIGLATLMYFGFALGVLRYRLFDLESWWFSIWVWLLGGAAVLLVDAMLIVLLGLQPAQALGLAVILVGWLYFPMRQWVWGRIAGTASVPVEQHLPELVEGVFAAGDAGEVEETWEATLRKVFKPLDVEQRDGLLTTPRVVDHGAALLVPRVEAPEHLRLLYARGGQKLYHGRDIVLVEALLGVTRRSCRVWRARDEGARAERQRILRDLHDDVGGRLLSLLHASPDDRVAQLTRSALQGLREAIYALDEGNGRYLEDALEEWRVELRQRLAGSGIELDWTQRTSEEAATRLSPRQYINVKRILSEAVTNALRHAQPTVLQVSWHCEQGRLEFRLINDGVSSAETTACGELVMMEGRGMHNMRTRAREIGARIEASPQSAPDGRYLVTLCMPLSEHA